MTWYHRCPHCGSNLRRWLDRCPVCNKRLYERARWRPGRCVDYNKGRCVKCGYPVTHSDSDRCPECGEPKKVHWRRV